VGLILVGLVFFALGLLMHRWLRPLGRFMLSYAHGMIGAGIFFIGYGIYAIILEMRG
jgi:hypothetical protein